MTEHFKVEFDKAKGFEEVDMEGLCSLLQVFKVAEQEALAIYRTKKEVLKPNQKEIFEDFEKETRQHLHIINTVLHNLNGKAREETEASLNLRHRLQALASVEAPNEEIARQQIIENAYMIESYHLLNWENSYYVAQHLKDKEIGGMLTDAANAVIADEKSHRAWLERLISHQIEEMPVKKD